VPVKHNLGFGVGKMLEFEDGTVAYIKSMEFGQAFRLPIADVTGFSVTKGSKMLERTIRIMGGGSVLAEVSVAHGVSEKIEEWFRAHPAFRSHAPATAAHVMAAASAASPMAAAPPPVAQVDSLLVADELRKLAELRDCGVLTDDEFAGRKQLLLAHS
jgi:hypothetical protein